MNQRFCLITLSLVFTFITCQRATAASGEVIEIDRSGKDAAIAINISGFPPDITAVLKNDLTFMGFTNTTAEAAKFLVSGSASGQLIGRVLERVNKNPRFSRSYTGPSLRAQAHAFADDIATTLTPLPGIAQTKIVFKVEVARGKSEIYLADYDGFNPQPVTRDGDMAMSPTWAGRGTLLYTSYKLGPAIIFSHQLSSGVRHAVARYGGSNISPAGSPDGTRVAMILSKGGSPDLYVANLDGSGLRRLTETPAEESSPCWSPDGRSICYVSKSSGANALYAVAPEGGSPRRIATTGVINPTEPTWSPDGKWIAFTSLMRDFNICRVEARGGKAEVLVTGEDPSWAPNSRALIFCKGPDHRKILSLLDVPTKQVKDIARISESNSQPAWAK